MKCIGIDIGSYSVKVFELYASPKSVELVDFQEHLLNSSQGADNKIAIIDILKSLAEQNDPNTTKYIFCLPQNQISTRHKFFPFRERSKVLKTIPFELEDDIPFDLEDSVFDAKFVRFLGSTSEVLASATLKKNVLAMLELAQSVGIDPDIISAEGLALANLVEDFQSGPPVEPAPAKTKIDDGEDEENPSLPERSPGHITLCLGHSTTTVNIYKNFRLVGLRTFYWGGSDIAAAISQRYRISYEEALKEVQSKAFILTNKEGASRDQVIFSDTISASFKSLIRDLRLFLVDAESEFHIDFSHMAITGGTSQIRNLSGFLSETFSIPANSLDIFENTSTQQMELTSQVKASAGLAFSLALEGAKRPINPATNFRKDELGKQSQTLQIFWNKWSHTLKVTAAALVLFYIYAFTKDFLASDLSDKANTNLKTQARSAGLRGSAARTSQIKRHVRNQKKEIRARKTLSKIANMNATLDILEKLSQTVPRKNNIDLNLSSFQVSNNRVLLAGSVASAAQLQLLESSLKSLSQNGKVSKRTNTSPNQVTFSYSFLVDRNISSRNSTSKTSGKGR